MSEVKILGVIDEDPYDYRTWSGSSRYFFCSLEKRGMLTKAIAAEPSKIRTLINKALSFHPNLDRWKFKYHLNTRYFRERTKTALGKIKSLPDGSYNVVLQIGAWYDLPGKTDKITVSYHDGNLYCLINESHERGLSQLYFVKRCMEYERELYKKMDIIFSMSRWLSESFCKGFQVRRDKVYTVGAGVNLPYIRKIENKSYDEPKILFVGKMFERKGGKYLLEAFGRVRREVPKAQLTLIGPNISELPDGVVCLGFINKNTKIGVDFLLNAYASASLFVMPSLYEPFGIVFAEAMAHKLPCIGTYTCAMPEIITEGETGFLVPRGDSKVLAERMIEILKNPGLAKEMGEKGYRKYEKSFTWDRVVEKMENIILSKFNLQ